LFVPGVGVGLLAPPPNPARLAKTGGARARAKGGEGDRPVCTRPREAGARKIGETPPCGGALPLPARGAGRPKGKERKVGLLSR
jgi:hypothetical protein